MVDNDHVAAWTEGMDYSIKFQSSSLWHSATSGEGLGMFFKGPGEIYVQSHAPSALSMRDDAHPHASGGMLRLCIIVVLVVLFILGLVSSGFDVGGMIAEALTDETTDNTGKKSNGGSRRNSKHGRHGLEF